LKVGNNNHTLEGKKLVPELKNSVKTAYWKLFWVLVWTDKEKKKKKTAIDICFD
jgi:hypothetical protein